MAPPDMPGKEEGRAITKADTKLNTLIHNVHRAMDTHEMQAFYQPKYDAITGRLIGAEALVRWLRPDGSVVMTLTDFLPQLERGKDILELDWYMLRLVCALLHQQEEENISRIPIAVNFSRLHVYESNCLRAIEQIVDGFHVPRHLIEVEITESAFIHEPELTSEWIRKMRNAGFRVAIDDFGTGVSSLSCIKDTPIDVLKIDKSLISHNCEDEKERIVLESVFNFANRLNMTTVAEGVETQEQLSFLRTCGCKVIQGFLFGKPMPADQFMQLCRDQAAQYPVDDILMTQPISSATQLLLEAVFTLYPLVIFANLTRNSFYMMAYENFTNQTCPSTGRFDDLIAHGAASMHPDDQELFRSTFSTSNLLAAHERGEKHVGVVTRQLGDDGVYRRVDTTDYFVKSPSVDDVLVIALCHNLDDD